MLDVGCGLGGPARHLADSHGVRVRGIDATEEFIAVGNAMSRWTALEERVDLVHGDALALPFADASFDRAVLLHVGMSIADKAALVSEVARVLRPRGMVIRQLPEADAERPHALKYRLYYGQGGERLVGYDNERGKGDHRHYRGHEEAYAFESVRQLVEDFRTDVAHERGESE